MSAPAVLDLDDPYFDGQTLPDALAEYEHVHSKTGGHCVKNARGLFCARATPTTTEETRGDAPRCPECRHQPHESLGFCPNLASDNDCSCTYAPARRLPTLP